MDLYPEMSFTDDKGKTHTERANRYFIMLGEDGDTKGVSLAERRFAKFLFVQYIFVLRYMLVGPAEILARVYTLDTSNRQLGDVAM